MPPTVTAAPRITCRRESFVASRPPFTSSIIIGKILFALSAENRRCKAAGIWAILAGVFLDFRQIPRRGPLATVSLCRRRQVAHSLKLERRPRSILFQPFVRG